MKWPKNNNSEEKMLASGQECLGTFVEDKKSLGNYCLGRLLLALSPNSARHVSHDQSFSGGSLRGGVRQ